MGWIEKLARTYDECADKVEKIGANLWPTAHFVKNAHLEVVIDGTGKFLRVRPLTRSESPTLIPATEDSAGRTSGEGPHPLSEELSYCAADLPGAKTTRFPMYLELLGDWCKSEFAHPKAKAVLAYVQKRSLWNDLFKAGVFPVKVEDAEGKKTKVADDKVFIRWSVEMPGEVDATTWADRSLIEAWQRFDASRSNQMGFCMVLGAETRVTQNHPRNLRRPGDGAKLVSANDFDNFTFRGRFTDTERKKKGQRECFVPLQGCGVSFDVSQKAHAALRWLITRQGYRIGNLKEDQQVYVAWSVGGKPVPDPWSDTLALLLGSAATPVTQDIASDAGQTFARNLARAMAGYAARLDPTEDIMIMGLDSVNPGRMAIIYYRELRGSELLARIRDWHARHAWPQNFGKDKRFIGAPAPHDIAEAAYATRLGTTGALQVDKKLEKATVERLLPCIVDGLVIPRDLVVSVVRRASNRNGLDRWEWEKVLGIACALFRGWSVSQGKEYQMTLEEELASRDYLYGRLLAVADNIESYALTSAEKNRDTTAARFMQRFADRPYSTWRTIELALGPYKSRLKANEKTAGFLWKRERLLDAIQCRFASTDFTDDRPLSGEFLLGYHCQRAALFAGTTEQPVEEPTSKENLE
jgi:CRISPR-associated protein Csd1